MIGDGAPAVVEATGVCKSYGKVAAVRDVDLVVRAGEIFALLGPNGAGKTTLVEMLEGLVRPDRGAVRILGMDPRRQQRAVRSRIGVVLQNHGVDTRLRVDEVARQFATYFRRGPSAARAALARFGLDERGRSFVGTLSGGERRRLDLALAVIGDPEVLFLDEPTANLDILGRRTVWEAVEGLAGSGSAIVLTTHLFDEAETFAHRVALMVDGRIVLDGPPGDLRAGRQRVLRARFAEAPGSLPGDRWTMDGRDVVLTCAEPLAALGDLVGWAHDEGLELQSLTLDAAPLENVLMDLFTAPTAPTAATVAGA
jgi:ABC-2 type transport system ATP-binding protein